MNVTLAQQLWQANQDLAQACLNHPFVVGIGDGTLPKARFADYVGQDAFFLEAFARAYSIAAAKTSDWADFKLFHRLAQGVLTELELHQGYAAQWGVNLREVQPTAATRHYTDFLLATAWGADIGLIAVAMIPCLRLYAFLGQELAKKGIGDHVYANWIRTYSDRSFEDLAQNLEDVANRHAHDNEFVRSTYRYALVCEEAFFTAAWGIA